MQLPFLMTGVTQGQEAVHVPYGNPKGRELRAGPSLVSVAAGCGLEGWRDHCQLALATYVCLRRSSVDFELVAVPWLARAAPVLFRFQISFRLYTPGTERDSQYQVKTWLPSHSWQLSRKIMPQDSAKQDANSGEEMCVRSWLEGLRR
jgi:hypothetical protein